MIRALGVLAALAALVSISPAPQDPARDALRDALRYVTDKEPVHEIDGAMLEAFLVAKKRIIDGYRPPNKLKDYKVAFSDYGPYYGIDFLSKTASGFGGHDPKRPSGLTVLVDKKTMKLVATFAGG